MNKRAVNKSVWFLLWGLLVAVGARAPLTTDNSHWFLLWGLLVAFGGCAFLTRAWTWLTDDTKHIY